MKQKIVVSNVRFPYEDWLIVKSGAANMGMSINEYFQYLSNREVIRQITGTKKAIPHTSRAKAFEALLKFANRKVKGKPMGANEDDKIIYGIE
jgi:hypothetical protein